MSAPTPIATQPLRPRSFFGPVVLVGLGAVLLLCTTRVITFPSVMWWFVRYWPVVLIVWGVVKLADYLWARQKGYSTPRLGAGSIVFVVFFILFGSMASGIAGWWPNVRDDLGKNFDFDPSDIFYNSYEFSEDFAQPLAEATEIKVMLRRGDVSVVTSPDNQAHAVINKKLRADSAKAADSMNQATHPKFQQQGSTWIMDLTNSPYEHGTFDLELQLPKNAVLSLSTGRGDLSVSDRESNVNLSTDNGDVTVTGVKGNASLRMRSGSATVKDVSGNVQVEGTVNDGSISGVGGTLDFNAGYNGDIELSRIGKSLRFKSVRTDLQAGKVDGEITMDRGDFHAKAVSGPFRLQTRSKDIRLDDISGDVQVENRNGQVEVHAKAPMGAIDISNFHGGIEINVPANAAFQLDAESVGGEIDSSDFSVTQDNRSHNATAKGTVGKGGPEMRLKTDHGTIEIKKQ